MSTDTSAPTPGWLSWLAQNRKRTAYLLAALSLPFIAFAIWRGTKLRADPLVPALDEMYLTIWSGTLALFLLGAAGWQLLVETERGRSALDDARMLVLTLGIACGLLTALLGVALLMPASYGGWWTEVISWLKPKEAKQLWKGVVVVGAIFGGLGLMFISLQGARTEERTNPFLRRLVYGNNAVLMGLLLFTILGIGNALLLYAFQKPIDFTTSNIYSLSERFQNILRGLNKPTKIYIIMPDREPLYDEVQTLLTNCRDVNPRIEVETLSPDKSLHRIEEMVQRYFVD